MAVLDELARRWRQVRRWQQRRDLRDCRHDHEHCRHGDYDLCHRYFPAARPE